MVDAAIAAPLLLVVVLASASAAKWKQPDELVSAARLLGLPGPAVKASRHVPIVEAVLAVGFLLSPWPASLAFAAATLGLMLAYTAVIARGLSLTPRPSCGCFGRIGHPITANTLVRNVVLSVLGVVALAWTAAGGSVPVALWQGGWPLMAWLLALMATAAVVWWIVSERVPVPVISSQAPHVTAPGDAGPVGADRDDDYVREPIPPIMLVQDDTPVTLRALAAQRAQLLVWVTCGCGRSYEAVDLAARWSALIPAIDVRMVSTRPLEVSRAMFPSVEAWLVDPGAGAMRALGMAADPAAILLGADGLLAGGPVEGLGELTEFGDLIAEQLSQVELPPATGGATPAPAPVAPLDSSLVRLSQHATAASLVDVAAGRPLMVLLVSEACHPCGSIRGRADEYAAALAGHGIRTALVYPAAPESPPPHDASLTWVDADATLASAFGIDARPAAVLLTADAHLHQGPVVGSAEVEQFVSEAAG